MTELQRLLLTALLCAAGIGIVSAVPALADEPKVKNPEQPATEPAKPIIIQLDASKLPPEVLKELLKLSKTTEPTKPATKPEPTKPATKPVKVISLSDAIAIAEKTTKGGTVVKAERVESKDGSTQFALEVLDGKGGKTRLTLDAGGNLTKTAGDNDEKGTKKKKKDDDDDKDEGKGKKKEKDD